LIVDDDEKFLGYVGGALEGDYEVRCAQSADAAIRLLSPPPDVVLLDLRLGNDDSTLLGGNALLARLHQLLPQLPVLIITAFANVRAAVESMRLGAADFIEKSHADIPEIKTRLLRAVEQGRIVRRLEAAEHDLRLVEPREIVGSGAKIQRVKDLIQVFAKDGNATVLIRGSTGTGKELIARAIHASSSRANEPFVPVTLSALPAQTADGELFGYEAGAFTDARQRHIGYLEKAHTGVLFLDEVGDLSLGLQAKLLRFLEEREFCRLGNTEPVRVDVQVLAATNADLEAMVREGTFREDFYYRVKVHEIDAPLLKERIEDLPLLVAHFLNLLRQRGKKVSRLSDAALSILSAHRWPGNVRHLKNALESAAFQAELHGRNTIETEDLPMDVRDGGQFARDTGAIAMKDESFSIDEALARQELTYVQEALRRTNGRKADSSQLLGYNDRFALSRRIKNIIGRFPNLSDEYPDVFHAFGGQPDRRKNR
jgi:DNA-binding NtrC family response regulator